MGTVSYNVSMIKARAEQYSRAQILQLLDEVQKYVYATNCEETTYVMGATGMPPFLRTKGGHFKYNCPSTCRETAAIFTLDTKRITRTGYKDFETYPRRYYFQGQQYFRVPVTTRQAQPGGVRATVKFPFDPGTTKETYYHLFYLNPQTLSTEDDDLTIPDNLHIHLRRAVLAILSSEDYGENGIDYNVLEKVASQIRNQMNRSPQLRQNITRPQLEYRDF